MGKGKRSVRPNITPLIIKGKEEFARAFGYKDPRKQAELRGRGLPCLFDGKDYVYIPEKVLAWMEENWKIELPNIPEI